MSASVELFTLTSLLSFAAVLLLVVLSVVSQRVLLPARSTSKARWTFGWLMFDALIHFSFEGSWLWQSFPPPRTVLASSGPFATLWKEYAQADTRWGTSDPVIVSIELLTVLGAGPICCWIMWRMTRGDRGVHYWIVVLSVGELYGGALTFFPEWLTNNQALNKANSAVHLWLHLFLMNMIWVVIPLLLLYDSFGYITLALRDPGAYRTLLANEEGAGEDRNKIKKR